MVEHFPADFPESDPSNDEFQESGSRKTHSSKVRTVSFNPYDEGLFGSHSGGETDETYNLRDIKDDDLRPCWQVYE